MLEPETVSDPYAPFVSIERRATAYRDRSEAGERPRLAASELAQEFVRARRRAYKHMPDPCRRILHGIERKSLDNGLVSRLLLATILSTARSRIRGIKPPPGLLAEFHRQFHRILDDLENVVDHPYVLGEDAYMKDLALCLGQMYPCVARVAELHSGVPRSIAWSGGVEQGLKFLQFAVRQRFRFCPFIELHTHTPMLDGFNPDGWTRCHEILAGVLAADSTILGTMCASWFYDPAMERVSPHLTYMREIAESGGALIFRVGSSPSDVANAMAKSRTRRRLYAEGRYQPTSYMIVWPRTALLKWAKSRST